MAFALLSHEVCDLTLGKPALPWLASSASVRDALIVLKLRADVSEISVWDCPPPSHPTPASQSPAHNHSASSSTGNGSGGSVGGPWHRVRQGTCQCVGKVCMQMIICYLATDQSLRNHAKALDAPLTVLLKEETCAVQHIDPEASLLEALGVIVAGAQNLVVQITGPSKKCRQLSKGSVSQKHFFTQKPVELPAQALLPKSHNGGCEYCWLAHEDVLRFLLGSIGIFSPLPMMSIKDLGMIQTDVLMVGVEDEAISALKLIKTACLRLTAVAVVESMDGERGSPKLVGEISCSILQTCNETAALALAALSVQDFLAYTQDCKCRPSTLTEAMCTRIYKKLGSLKGRDQNHLQEPLSKFMDGSQMLQDLERWEESSDDEFGAGSPMGPHDLSHKWHLGHFHSSSRAGYMAKIGTGPIFCRPTSSLIAVIMQALAHREHYVWVTKEDDTLVGIVTFTDILSVLSNHLNLSC